MSMALIRLIILLNFLLLVNAEADTGDEKGESTRPGTADGHIVPNVVLQHVHSLDVDGKSPYIDHTPLYTLIMALIVTNVALLLIAIAKSGPPRPTHLPTVDPEARSRKSESSVRPKSSLSRVTVQSTIGSGSSVCPDCEAEGRRTGASTSVCSHGYRSYDEWKAQGGVRPPSVGAERSGSETSGSESESESGTKSSGKKKRKKKRSKTKSGSEQTDDTAKKTGGSKSSKKKKKRKKKKKPKGAARQPQNLPLLPPQGAPFQPQNINLPPQNAYQPQDPMLQPPPNPYPMLEQNPPLPEGGHYQPNY